MADVIEVQAGMPPWLPTASAEPVSEYHYFDVPLMGIVRDQGVEYFFNCIWGHEGPMSLWMYARVSLAERESLDAVVTMDQFDEVVRGLPDRNAVMALAFDPVGILASTVFHTGSEDDAERALNELQEAMNRFAASLDDARDAVAAV